MLTTGSEPGGPSHGRRGQVHEADVIVLPTVVLGEVGQTMSANVRGSGGCELPVVDWIAASLAGLQPGPFEGKRLALRCYATLRPSR